MNEFARQFAKAKRTLMRQDAAVRELIGRHRNLKFIPKMERTPFESLVRAVAHQQLHGKAAETILARMLALFPNQNFPEPKALFELADIKLRECGFSTSKTKAIKDIAHHTLIGVVPTCDEIQKISNEEIIERLTRIYGVGRWTVEMLLIFKLGRLDVWPVDDFGVRKGYQIWKKKKAIPDANALRKIGPDFAPYQSVIALYLWREADLAKSRK